MPGTPLIFITDEDAQGYTYMTLLGADEIQDLINKQLIAHWSTYCEGGMGYNITVPHSKNDLFHIWCSHRGFAVNDVRNRP